MSRTIRPSTLSGIKRLAKHIKKERGLEHAHALDEAAREAGFQNYRHARTHLEQALDPAQAPQPIDTEHARPIRIPEPFEPTIEQAKALSGKHLAMLNEVERRTFNFYVRRGRKYGVTLTVQDGDGEITVQFRSGLPTIEQLPDPWDAEQASRLFSGSVIKGGWGALAFGLQTKRDVTLDDFHGLGKLVVPKGSRVIVKDAGKTDGAWVLADVFVAPDAVFYGIRIGVDDVESIATHVADPNDSPSR